MEATLKQKQKQINGKPLQVCASSAFNDMYGGLEAAHYQSMAISLLNRHPVDMIVFEQVHVKKGKDFVKNADNENQIFMQVRSAGYKLDGSEAYPDETTILHRGESLNFKKFWFKLDDYGEKYVGTFLFPEDY